LLAQDIPCRPRQRVKLVKLLTENGSQFADPFTVDRKKGTQEHTRPRSRARATGHPLPHFARHPQTNGTAERFNGRIGDIFNWTRLGSRAQLESTLRNTSKIYNHGIPQHQLNHKHLFRHSKSRARNALNCSGNACVPSRALTGIQANTPKRSVP
jgi:hypothetical protein